MAIYYVDTNAAAGGDGTTQELTGANCAWDTIADVNAASFNAGDSILFKEGCTWREKLTVPSSGSNGSPITFGTYGDGNAPKILRSVAKNATSDWTCEHGDGTSLYSSHFEGGDLSEWDTATEVGSSTITAHADAAFIGSYGAKFTIAAGDDAYLKEGTFADQTDFYCRFYINFNSLTMGDEEEFNLLTGRDDAATYLTKLEIEYESTGDYYYMYLRSKDDDGNYLVTPGVGASGWECSSIIDGEWHCIEVRVKAATGEGQDDGIIQFWVDGTSRGSKTDMDNDTRATGEVWVGSYNNAAGTSGTIYIDAAVVDTTAIGQASLWYTASATEIINLIYDSEDSEATMVELKASLDTNGEAWYDDPNDRIYVYSLESNPATAYSGSIELALLDNAIDINDKAYITVDGLDMRYVGNDAILATYSATGSNLIVQNCNFKFISSNLFGDTHTYGRSIKATTYDDSNFSDNTFEYTATAVNNRGDGTAWVVTIDGNTVSNMHGYAGNLDAINFGGSITDYDGSVVSDNDLSGFGDEGIDLFYAQNVVVRNNIIHENAVLDGTGSGCGIKAGGAAGASHSTGHEILRNKIYTLTGGTANYGITANNGSSVTCAYNLIYDVERGIDSGALGGDGENDSWLVYNNVFYDCTQDYGVDVSDNLTWTVQNNIFRNCNTSDMIAGAGATVTGGYNCFEDAAVAGAGTYNDTGTSDLYSTDPLFVNAASDNFYLQSTSPCIDAGVDVSLTEDYVGHPIIGTVDMGAYEFQVISIGAGSYTATGQTMTPLRDALLGIGAGSYSLTGTAMSPLRDALIDIVAGSYTLTGKAVTFVKTEKEQIGGYGGIGFQLDMKL